MQIFPVVKKYNEAKAKWEKIPRVPKGVHWGEYKATAQELAEAKNLGAVIPVGRVVIDLDVYKGATREAVDAGLGCSLDWDAAALQKTVSGGEHYCFALPDGVTVRQGSDVLGIQGLDTRASGKGWICTGEGYEDLTFYGMPAALFELDFPMLPKAAIDRLGENSKSVVTDVAFRISDDVDDLARMVQERTDEDVTVDVARAYLEKIPQERIDNYDSWVAIGMALHHQFHGDKVGLDLWIECSQRGKNFDKQACVSRWEHSFKASRNGERVTTFGYIKKIVEGSGAMDVVKQNLFDELVEVAEGVSNLDEYQGFKSRVRKLSYKELPKDLRSMVCAALHSSFGKSAGLTKAELRDQLAPAVVVSADDVSGKTDAPEWVQGWVYCEVPSEFANVDLDYRIKRESFNAKYNREPECMNQTDPDATPMYAADFALNKVQIPTVVDTMFWPGAERVFTFEGKPMLNTYYADGIEIVQPSDYTDDEQEAVTRFLEHIDLLVEDPDERGVLLDWLSYVYQNPGKKMTWALLIQGAEGVGKSYFGNVMQTLLGRNMKTIDATAITGRFNGWAHGATLVAIEEIKISGENKYDIIDRLKPIISNSVVSVEEKGRDIRTVPNFTNYMMFTNHKDALPLSENDRRYAVIFSRFQSLDELNSYFKGVDKAQDYFDRLFKDLDEYPGAIAGYLANYKQRTCFAPKGRAPLTASKARMQRFNYSETDDFIDNAIGMGCAVFNERFIDATWLTELLGADGTQIPTGRALGAALRGKGYEPIPSRRIKIGKGYHYIWTKPNIAEKQIVQEVRDFFKKTEDDPDDVTF